MAAHTRAAKALVFMQRCRQQTSTSKNLSFRRHASSTSNFDSLNPSQFGKKLRLADTTSEPIPAWRIPKPDAPSVSQNIEAYETEKTKSKHGQVPGRSEIKTFDIQRARNFPVPRYRHNPARSTGWWGFIKHTILRLPEPPIPEQKLSWNVFNNPYKVKKQWPPNLNEMSELQQFHYEKTFRRRLVNKTKSLRFNWDRWALFLRRFIIGTLIFYFALIAEPPNPDTRVPPDGLRYWMYGKLRQTGDFFPKRTQAWIESQYQYYRRKHKRQWDPYNHEGWDQSRPVNSLPGKAAPAVNQPLQSPE